MKVKRITSIWLAILLAGFQMNSFAQEEGDNYSITRTFLDESQTKTIDEVTFYNGLGFPIVELTKGVTPNGDNIVRGTSYDNRGRVLFKSVPMTVSGMNNDPYMLQSISMIGFRDRTPYSSYSYEASSQSRLLETRGPGDAWSGKSVRTEYLLSHNRDPRFSCKRYFADTGSGAPVCSGRYPDGALEMTMTIDEDNDTTMVFTSSRGEQVLCRQICNGELLDTYYVNDALGRTRFILQPMYQQDSSIVHYAFEYRYDDSGKTVYSHTPDGAVSRFWYDKAGHLTFSQDSNQRTASPEKFIFHFYDSMDREVINGECTAADTAGIASYIYCASYSESSGTVCNSGYILNRVMPFSNGTLLKALFYDNYTHLNRAEFSDRSVFPVASNPAAAELPTGSITATLEQGVSKRLYSSFYYDEFGRLQTSVRTNLQGGYDKEQTQYSFTGKPVSKTISHTGNANLTEALNYTYDNADRLSSICHRTGSGATETILSCTYDELTRLSTETFGGGSQTKRTYGYNIRDQITSISSGKFNQNLYYASFGPNASISQPRYGGSPGAMIWTAGNSSGIHGYSFNYDNAGRLLNSTYAYGNLQNQNIGLYSESIGTYDSNGNVCSVTRAGATTTLQHNGNRLSGSQYSYDANGNLTKDTGRGISAMTYNCLNLPSSVTLQDGNGINYIYSADGEKLKETVTSQGGTQNATEYSGNLIFKNGALQMMLTQTGYVTFSGSTPTYHYYQKDYLGNNRVVMRANGTVEQVNTYYPFGESISFLSSGADIQPLKLSGKPFETQTSSYDFGARYYAPAINSWTTPDPLAQKYPGLSPYAFCAGNPVMYVDNDGARLRIPGKAADAAISQIENAADGVLKLSRNKNNEISYSINSCHELSDNAKLIKEIIDHPTIMVSLIAKDNITTYDNRLIPGGCFEGTFIDKDNNDENITHAIQCIVPAFLENLSKYTKSENSLILHELTEAYQAALISQKRGKGSPAAKKAGSVYRKAHSLATPAYEGLRLDLYDKNGVITDDMKNTHRAVFYIYGKQKEKIIIQEYRPPVN